MFSPSEIFALLFCLLPPLAVVLLLAWLSRRPGTICPGCGKKAPLGAQACPACGHAIPSSPPSHQKKP